MSKSELDRLRSRDPDLVDAVLKCVLRNGLPYGPPHWLLTMEAEAERILILLADVDVDMPVAFSAAWYCALDSASACMEIAITSASDEAWELAKELYDWTHKWKTNR